MCVCGENCAIRTCIQHFHYKRRDFHCLWRMQHATQNDGVGVQCLTLKTPIGNQICASGRPEQLLIIRTIIRSTNHTNPRARRHPVFTYTRDGIGYVFIAVPPITRLRRQFWCFLWVAWLHQWSNPTIPLDWILFLWPCEHLYSLCWATHASRIAIQCSVKFSQDKWMDRSRILSLNVMELSS